jgi:two-component system sensor histidine kinase KdpD
MTGFEYNGAVLESLLSSKRVGYLVAILGAPAVTALLVPFRYEINSTTPALAYLLAVLFIALFWGSGPALVASVVGVLCFNFFFIPPLYTFDVAHSENWIALFAFFTTALAVGQLSARAKRRAEEAERSEREIERLYQELQTAFERASQAEALKQSERLKSALLDAVTHDLRTPLTSIKASITTLIDETRAPDFALDKESRLEMMEVIDQESDRLNRFIGDLIELARIEAGELQLRPRWGTVDEIISTALARAEPLTARHHVETEIEKELPLVRVDNRAVSEAVYSLVDNAAKYSPEGSTIRILANRGDDAMVQIAVEDEGRGIPAEMRERVFDKFFRAMRDGDITTREPSGTGMGLAIAKGIVEAHGGQIWIREGRGGKGTRINFTVPIGDDEVVETAVTQSHGNGGAA